MKPVSSRLYKVHIWFHQFRRCPDSCDKNIEKLIETPAEPLQERPDFPITPEEARLVDVNAVYSLLTAAVKTDLKEIFPADTARHNASDFVSRKLIQMIKQVKANKEYAMDLFNEMLLMQIIEDSFTPEEECPEEWKKFVKAYADSFMEEDADDDYAKEMYESAMTAGKSLWNMYNEDLDYGHGFLLWDMDYDFLAEKGLIEGLFILASPVLGYSSKDYYQIFTSVGYNVPAKVAVMREIREE